MALYYRGRAAKETAAPRSAAALAVVPHVQGR